MGILGRMNQVLKSNLNNVLDRSEDPEKMVNQTIQDMEDALRDGRKELIESKAAEKVALSKCSELEKKIAHWEDRARLALKAGEEDLARQALVEKHKFVRELDQQKEIIAAQQANISNLNSSIEGLEKKVNELKGSKNIIIAKIKDQKRQDGPVTSTSSKAFQEFSRFSDKIDHLEAEAEAGKAMGGKAQEEDLEAKFAELETKMKADNDLDELKKKMNEDK